MGLRLYDAHNHLQDDRLKPFRPAMNESFAREGIVAMVVNGSSETDWPQVQELRSQYLQVIPSFGYHPWYVREQSRGWKETLLQFLDRTPSAVGEIGLDRWIKDYDFELQQDAFTWQLRLAAGRNLPVSIHCLQAWGKLLEILRSQGPPKCGFVLHSFGGPKELVPELCDLGAYFSLPGYFAHERKTKQREAFLSVPLERLLIETDAPDQILPGERNSYPLVDSSSGKPLNHPANLVQVYRFASELLETPMEQLAARVEHNFHCVFARVMSPQQLAEVGKDKGKADC